MKRLLIIGLAAGLLTACATGGSECVIRMPSYTAAEQAEAAAGEAATPPAVWRLVEDYGQVRAEWRAACGR